MLKKILLHLAAAVATFCAAAALADSAKQIDVPAGDLVAALESISRQANVELIFQPDQLRGMRTKGVKGQLSVQEAVRRLLEGTQLKLSRDENTGAMMIGAADGISKASASLVRTGDTRMAQTQTAQSPQKAQATSTQEPAAEAESSKGVPEILVKGSRSVNTDIRRSEDDTQPYVVFDSEEITRSQASTLEEFLKTRLPMNAARDDQSQQATAFYGNTSLIDLRGLGTNQTLILIDGRRMPSGNGGGALFGTLQPDINGIALASIDRIEILPSTASGIYGGGATGGVINIITRKDYQGVDIGVSYGNTEHSNAPFYRLDGSAGFTLPDGRTSVLLSASYADSEPLLMGDYDYIRRGRQLLFRNNPGAFNNLTTPPMGYTTNIRSSNGANLVFDDGTPLNSNRTFIPVGYAGYSSDNGAQLRANAGTYNLDPPAGLNSGGRSLLNTPAITSASANLRRSFGSRVEAFADFSLMDNQGHTVGGTNVSGSVTLPANSAANPFTTNIVVRYPVVGPAAPRDIGFETVRASGGLIVRLGHEWTAAGDYGWNRSRSTLATTSPVISVGSSVFASNTLNVMRDVNLYPLDWAPYLLESPNYTYTADTILRMATLRLSGPAFSLPAGAVMLSGFIERTDEDLQEFTDYFFGDPLTIYPGTSQRNTAFYAEAGVPLTRTLQLQVSARRDRYATTSYDPSLYEPGTDPEILAFTNRVTATKFTAGLRYEPTPSLMLRASYGTGFLPASIDQIAPSPPLADSFSVIDNGVEQSYDIDTDPGHGVIVGGNPGLKPEDSKALSVGMVLKPAALAGLRLSVDYTRIRKKNEIVTLPYQTIFDFFPERITRDVNGIPVRIDASAANFARTRLEAYDIQADYDWQSERFGSFHFYSMATYQPQLIRQTSPDDPAFNIAGFTSGILKWRGNGGITWDKGSWTAGWNTQYFHSYASYSAFADALGRAAATLNQGSATIARQIYHDVTVEYAFREAGTFEILKNTRLSLGIQNIFDTSPPIVAVSGANFGGYSAYGNPRLRRFTLTIRKHF